MSVFLVYRICNGAFMVFQVRANRGLIILRRCIHIEINVVYLGRATAILYAEVMTILIENEKCHQ